MSTTSKNKQKKNSKIKKKEEIEISGMDLCKLYQQYPGLSNEELLNLAISTKKIEKNIMIKPIDMRITLLLNHNHQKSHLSIVMGY